jgi:hypothetical protein
MALQTLAWKLRAAIVTDADEHGKALKEYSMLTMINDCNNGVFSRASELQAFQAVIEKTNHKREAIVAAQAPKPKKSRVQRVKKGIYPVEGYPGEDKGSEKAKPLEKMKMRKRTVEKVRMRKNGRRSQKSTQKETVTNKEALKKITNKQKEVMTNNETQSKTRNASINTLEQSQVWSSLHEKNILEWIKVDALVGVVHHTPYARKWEFEMQAYGTRYTIKCKIHSVMVPVGAKAGDMMTVLPQEHNHGNTSVQVVVPDGANSGDIFQVAQAYDLACERSLAPDERAMNYLDEHVCMNTSPKLSIWETHDGNRYLIDGARVTKDEYEEAQNMGRHEPQESQKPL